MKSTQQLIAEYLDIHAQRRKVLTIIAIFMIAVAFIVISVTIFPAITMQGDNESICGLQEHTHTEECYTKKLICELTEVEEHHHGETCYEKKLKCKNTEKNHKHTDECYENTLICSAKETDGHIHTEKCYEKNISCDIPEHTHTEKCYPKDRVVAMDNLKLEGSCYKPVRSVEALADSDASYIIVSPDGNNGIMNNDGKPSLDELKIETIPGNKNLYSAKSSDGKDITKEKSTAVFKWSIIAGNDQATIRNASDGRYYINLKENNVLSKDSDMVTLEFSEKQGTWKITQKVDGVMRYLVNTEEGVISTNDASVGNNKWLIFKLSDDEINKNHKTMAMNNKTPNTDASALIKNNSKVLKAAKAKMAAKSKVSTLALNDDGNVKNDKGYIEPSASKTGGTIYKNNLWEYSSDPGTSQIESEFNGIKADDGKVLVDKSVIYGADDYNAFSKYDFGTFGVELSALAQQYNVLRKTIVNIPVDVVFILDTSGSMKLYKAGSDTRMTAAVNALNPAIDMILKANSENRIGVVKFSNTSETMIPIDFYNTKTNADYFSYSGDQVTASMTKQSGETVTASTSGNGGTNTEKDWGGTYTQHGIARANELFQGITDTTYTDAQGKEVARKPIIIMLTDGEPTFCTSNYSDVMNGPHYGAGYGSTVENNKGIHGYCTVLSAISYKQQIAEHYNNKYTSFFTIGIGIDPVSNELMEGTVAGQNYTRAVLNPTKENVAAANNPSVENNDYCGGMFSLLMNNNYNYSTVTIASDPNTATGGTSADVPVVKNPYIDSGYSYSDGAYFGQMTTEELNEVFKNIIETSIRKIEYGFNLRKDTAAQLTDPIGEGMEVKGDPVLRYNGKNYNCTDKQTSTNADGSTVVKYIYSYTAEDKNITDADGNIRSVDLSCIDINVVTDKNGKQTVSMGVPEECMPVYSPDPETSIYSEELPARLIFQVGLTDEALANAAPGDVFYTNRWENGEQASAIMYPSDANPYYENGVGPYKNSTAVKTDNATQTNENANQYTSADEQRKISVALGNNGKLVLSGTKENIKITAQKKWQNEDGSAITDTADLPNVTLMLYRKLNQDGAKEELVDTIVLNNENSWQYVWDKMPYSNEDYVLYTYYVREITPEGYVPSISGSVSANDGTITVTNRKIPKEGALAVKKVWQNYFGDTISDTGLFNDIDVKLYRHVQIFEPGKVTVTINAGGTLLRKLEVQKGTDVTFTIRASYGWGAASSASIQKDGITVTSNTQGLWGATARVTSTQTITANSDITINYTSENARSWSFDSGPTYTAPTGSGTVTQGEDEYVDTVTLGNTNNWQYLWDNLVVSKKKDDGNTYTYTYYIKEDTQIPGYTTSYSDGNTAGVQGGEIVVTNKSMYYMDVLPETGSTGTGGYILGGLVSVIIAGSGLCKGWCIRRRKSSTSG